MSFHGRKDIAEIIARLRGGGFVVEDKTGKKHLKLQITAPNGCKRPWTISSTPSDGRRGAKNELAQLRRLLAECGYHDTRKSMRISMSGSDDTGLHLLFALLDRLESEGAERPEDLP